MTTGSESSADDLEAIKGAATALTARVRTTIQHAQSVQRGLLGLLGDSAATMTSAADLIERGHADQAIENLRASAEALGRMVIATGSVQH